MINLITGLVKVQKIVQKTCKLGRTVLDITMEILVVTAARPDEQTLNPGINYYTQKAHIVDPFVGNDGLTYYRVAYITDIYGRTLPMPVDGIVNSLSVKLPVDASKLGSTNPKQQLFYNRDSTDQLTAIGFVDISDKDGLNAVGRIPLGTGVYGKYFFNDLEAVQDILPGESVYRIDASDCYTLVDGAHGDLLILASIFTNRHINEALRNRGTTISQEQLEHLTTLWKMVFARTSEAHKIGEVELGQVITSYISTYYINQYHSVDNRPLQLLPINAILEHVGYHGIFSTDSYNNSRDRGCVSYNISQATAYRVGNAQY